MSFGAAHPAPPFATPTRPTRGRSSLARITSAKNAQQDAVGNFLPAGVPETVPAVTIRRADRRHEGHQPFDFSSRTGRNTSRSNTPRRSPKTSSHIWPGDEEDEGSGPV